MVQTSTGPVAFFVAASPDGRELWKSDGTAAGTVLVKDISPGSASSSPTQLASVGSTLFFSASDGVNGIELWKSDGTATGTVLIKDIHTTPASSGPSNLASIGGVVLFSANDGVNGLELWRTDGTAAGTALVKDIAFQPGWSSAPHHLTSIGGVAFFTAENGLNGDELWRSDGTAAGTSLVYDVAPGASSSRPSQLTAVGNLLFFVAHDGVSGQEVWRSDGTSIGTVRLKDINAGAYDSFPDSLTAVGATLFFSANDGVNGWELWKSDGTSSGTFLVKDIRPGAQGSDPRSLASTGTSLFFSASDGLSGQELWRTDGSASSTELIKDINPGATSSAPAELVFLGSTLFLRANDGVHGPELWKSDGTATGTLLVKDIRSGSASSTPTQLMAAGGDLYFVATDGAHGAELWRSDGTNAGTVMVADLNPGARSSSPGYLTQLGGRLIFAATDSVVGNEPWALSLDPTPPLITPQVSGNLGANGWYISGVSVSFTVADPESAIESTTGCGATTVSQDTAGVTLTCSATSVGGTSSRAVTVKKDSLAPWIQCPPPETAEATSASGAAVSFSAPTATDAIDASPAIVVSSPSGTTFPLGTTQVVASATDQAGNRSACDFAVSVVDTTPPAVQCPADLAAEATSHAGAIATYTVTATDSVDASPLVIVTHGSAAVFPKGATQVGATAVDRYGNSAACGFTVTVADTTAPVVRCPASVTAEAAGPAGSRVAFTVGVHDAADPAPALALSQASGVVFPLGTTRVEATATDADGNTSGCAFDVEVRDTVAPVLVCPARQTLYATGPEGAQASFAAGAADLVDGSPALAYSTASGSTFSLGTTTVNVTATDGSGNESSCSFEVAVLELGVRRSRRPRAAAAPERVAPGRSRRWARCSWRSARPGAAGLGRADPCEEAGRPRQGATVNRACRLPPMPSRPTTRFAAALTGLLLASSCRLLGGDDDLPLVTFTGDERYEVAPGGSTTGRLVVGFEFGDELNAPHLLTARNVPEGVSVTFSPPSFTGPSTHTVTVTATAQAVPSEHLIEFDFTAVEGRPVEAELLWNERLRAVLRVLGVPFGVDLEPQAPGTRLTRGGPLRIDISRADGFSAPVQLAGSSPDCPWLSFAFTPQPVPGSSAQLTLSSSSSNKSCDLAITGAAEGHLAADLETYALGPPDDGGADGGAPDAGSSDAGDAGRGPDRLTCACSDTGETHFFCDSVPVGCVSGIPAPAGACDAVCPGGTVTSYCDAQSPLCE